LLHGVAASKDVNPLCVQSLTHALHPCLVFPSCCPVRSCEMQGFPSLYRVFAATATQQSAACSDYDTQCVYAEARSFIKRVSSLSSHPVARYPSSLRIHSGFLGLMLLGRRFGVVKGPTLPSSRGRRRRTGERLCYPRAFAVRAASHLFLPAVAHFCLTGFCVWDNELPNC
jgi:hypothetical protein